MIDFPAGCRPFYADGDNRRKEVFFVTITGRYEQDDNFTTVYADNRIYTIARNTGDWDSVAVGERTAMGQVLDQETYNKWARECSSEGTFELA